MIRWPYYPGTREQPKDARKANRGDAFEELLVMVAEQYKSQGVAVIQKIPTAWKPVRGDIRNSGFISCKIDDRIPKSVDFIGSSIIDGCKIARPTAFEAKHTERDRIRWDAVSDEERRFLDCFSRQPGSITFVLCSFRMEYFVLVPWVMWRTELDQWEKKGRGKGASFTEYDNPYFEVKSGRTALDYLATWSCWVNA